jgi:hypothetical protein
MTMTDPHETLGPEEGGGPPTSLMPWTLVVEDEGWSADLEHGAPVPRAGDLVEWIADTGDKRLFRVVRVVHTVQSSSTARPLVRDEHALPNSTVEGPSDGPPRALRAGLPRVIVSPEDG